MEFLKNLINPITERVKSPFYGAFVFSWLIVNWKVLLAFFSDKDIIEGISKYKYIALELNQIEKVLCYPLLFTAIYLVALPWIDYFALWYSEFVKKEKIKKKNFIGKKYNVSGEKYYTLWELYKQQREELGNSISLIDYKEKEISEARTEIDALNLELKEKNNLLHNYSTPKELHEVMTGQWRHSFRFSKDQGFVREKIVSVSENNAHFLLPVTGGFENYGTIDYIIIDSNLYSIKFIFSEDDFKSDFQRIFLHKDRDFDISKRYIGYSQRADGKQAEVYFEKVLR